MEKKEKTERQALLGMTAETVGKDILGALVQEKITAAARALSFLSVVPA